MPQLGTAALDLSVVRIQYHASGAAVADEFQHGKFGVNAEEQQRKQRKLR